MSSITKKYSLSQTGYPPRWHIERKKNNMADDTKKKATDNPWADDNFEEASQGEIIKWEKVGQEIKGKLTQIDSIPNEISGKTEMVFTVEQEDGTPIRVWERACFKPGMKQAVIGQLLKFKFLEERASRKNPTLNKYKLIKLYLGPIIEDEKEAIENLKF